MSRLLGIAVSEIGLPRPMGLSGSKSSRGTPGLA